MRTPPMVWGLALLLATACGGGTVRSEPGALAKESSGGEDDPLSGRSEQIAERMTAIGWHRAAFESEGFLPENASTTLPLEVPAGRCFTIVALATRGIRDLDAVLYAPSGDVLAEDVRPDPNPALQLCSGEQPRRAYFHLQAYGAGAYRILSFEASRELLPEVEQALGLVPASAPGGEMSSDLRSSEQHEFGAGLRRRGFEPIGGAARIALTKGQRVHVPLPVERGQCYTIGVFAGGPVGEISLRIVDELGDDLARSIRASSAPAVQLCSTKEQQLTVEIAAEKGRGNVDLVVFRGRDAVVGGAGGLWLGRRAEGLYSRVALRERLPEEDARASRHGYGPNRRVGSGELVRAQAVAHRHTLEAGRCSMIRATGGEGIGRLYLRIVDLEGKLLSERESRGPVATARLCAGTAIPVEVQLVVRGGGGSFVLDAATKALPKDLPNEVTLEHAGRWLDALEDEMDGWAVKNAQVLALPAALDVPVDGCHRIRVFPLSTIGTIETSLARNDEGRAVDGGRFTELLHCAGDANEGARLEVQSRDGAPRAAFIHLEKIPSRHASASP